LRAEVKRIGKIFDVRGLSSSFRSVDALLTKLPAVVEHLQQASGDSSQPANERAKATGMVNKLKSWAFLSEVALLRDVLEMLKNLLLYGITIGFNTRNEEQTGLLRAALCRGAADRPPTNMPTARSHHHTNQY